ncbi:MAG: TetR/AcrR family transcriptional regulator [Bacillota bacterium]
MSKVDETIENIMEATVRVAFRKGFANTRTSDIAKEAGVSEGLIFKYFPTKSHLFATIIKDNFQRIKKGVDLIIGEHSLSALAKIEALIDFHFDFFTNQRNIAYLILGHSDRKIIGNVEPILEYGIKPYTQLIAEILKNGIDTGEFRHFDPETVAIALVGTMQITLIVKILSGKGVEEATKKEVKEYILAGIRK